MDREEWLSRRDSRSIRYCGRRLDPTRWISITVDHGFARTYEGQVALIVAGNLLGRMTPSVAISVPSVGIVSPLPWAGESLPDCLLRQMLAADPAGHFIVREPLSSDIRIHFGSCGATEVVHGSGWDAYIGPSPSPLRLAAGPNPFGAALAAILVVSRLFVHNLLPPSTSYVCNALNWRELPAPQEAAPPCLTDLGELWFVGLGSVGTAVLYFLTLATRDFSTALIDMDEVKIENLDRSPIFVAEDAAESRAKVAATERYLRAVGVAEIKTECLPLHESDLWRTRPPGKPDVLVSAANERNVRNFIEEGFPPLQLYATTGKNWQTALLRHVPFKDPCSLCLFPNDAPQRSMKCATAPAIQNPNSSELVMDAALPFLSFAAGLMTAAELTKLAHPSYPFSANRVFLQTQPEPALLSAFMLHRPGCLCGTRNTNVHRKMLAGTRYTER